VKGSYSYEEQYLQLLRSCLVEGTQQSNRTGIDTRFLPGAMLQFDLRMGFPALTTKRLAFGQVVGELIGFLRGYTSAADFREVGCNIWDANANKNRTWLNNPNRLGEDDLGRIYGALWRGWGAQLVRDFPSGKIIGAGPGVDQLQEALRKIFKDPTNRRNIVTAWDPTELPFQALPPCHLLYQFLVNVERKEINMCMYQRSCDMFLGVPFNMASYALLLSLVAKVTGYRAATLTMFLADVHVYVNHTEQIWEQLWRQPLAPPRLYTSPKVAICASPESALEVLTLLEKDDVLLSDYRCHPPISAPMAV